MNQSITSILKNSGLSITESRTAILQLFQQKDSALSHNAIEQQTGKEFDRVTIYRTLQTFVEKGIIHTIPTADNAILYALCKDACEAGFHQDNHVHFICNDCNNTFCLDHVIIPFVKLPKGFIQMQSDVVISGICKNCNKVV
jgi:Fur family ferric uptake transcriptional regulator